MVNARVLLLPCTVFIIYNYIFIELTNASKKMYYIYQWGGGTHLPFMFVGPGQSYFIKQKCRFTNCYVTSDRAYFRDIRKFDAIIFDSYNLIAVKERKYLPTLPSDRSEHQKYIFSSVESEANYPMCFPFYDDFFNWTWTYKLDSDFRRKYVSFYDKKSGKFMGPKINKKWKKYWNPIDAKMKEKLQYKSELAAWFVSNCQSKDKRRLFVNKVQEALMKLGGPTVDIFGQCGRYDCPRGNSKCARMLKRDYFFYFAFENSFSRDYVTEKLLSALDNYNIPVVFGGADYDRFLPPGTYLNARELGPENLARRMLEISRNTSAYYNFFRWRNHLVYRDTLDSESCNLCRTMNNDKLVREKKSLKDFRKWWNEDLCPK